MKYYRIVVDYSLKPLPRMDPAAFRDYLISHATFPERKLCKALDACEYKDAYIFQAQIGPYFVDFLFPGKRLIIEIDGYSHKSRKDYDARRTAYLERQGYRVMRLSNGYFTYKNNQCRSLIDRIRTTSTTRRKTVKRKTSFIKAHINPKPPRMRRRKSPGPRVRSGLDAVRLYRPDSMGLNLTRGNDSKALASSAILARKAQNTRDEILRECTPVVTALVL